MSFIIDWYFFFLALIVLFCLYSYLSKKKALKKGSLLYPSINILDTCGPGIRASLHYAPESLKMIALGFFFLALIDPHYEKSLEDPATVHSHSTQGAAIYIVLDRSGSMNKKILHSETKDNVSFGTKLDVLKRVTDDFIKQRPTDLIGLVAFARSAQVIAPLTLDHDAVSKELHDLKVVQDPDQDGTAIGYAIFKTASVIAATKHYASSISGDLTPAYDIKGSAIILVTDGFQSPHPDDKGKRLRTMGIDEAAAYAKRLDARLYIISIDPAITISDYAPHRNLLSSSAESTGGKFYYSEDAGDLDSIYSEIDKIERSIIPTLDIHKIRERLWIREKSYFPYLIAFGILSLISSILLETLYFRRIP